MRGEVKGCGHLAMSLPRGSQACPRHQRFFSGALSFGQGMGAPFQACCVQAASGHLDPHRDASPCRRCPVQAPVVASSGVQRRGKGEIVPVPSPLPWERNEREIPPLCVITAFAGGGAPVPRQSCACGTAQHGELSEVPPACAPALRLFFWSKRPPFHHHYRQTRQPTCFSSRLSFPTTRQLPSSPIIQTSRNPSPSKGNISQRAPHLLTS